MAKFFETIVIGSGPAGYTASIYLGRADVQHLLIASSLNPGGALMNTPLIENFPGFPQGISGPKLMGEMQIQAEKFGTEIIYENAQKITQITGNNKFTVETADQKFETSSLILAMGGTYKKLKAVGENKYAGKGVSYCATCDGFFFKNKIVAVIGGGDTALEEALFLAEFAAKVYIVHRRDQLRASEILQDRVKQEPKISYVLNALVKEIVGNENAVTTLNLQAKPNTEIIGASNHLTVDGVFVAIGHVPNSSVVQNLVELDNQGYIKLFKGQRTSNPNIYAAGDITDPTYRQAITAAASGCKAAKDLINARFARSY
ncbi:MAG: thioredoxin-disulfide reductase [Bifidobacteriaceae bacterium]|jgi:thioredoxin reductase (NADPH)|nr:thioredoxin-disulfide reductase [Bifidobacteriaceae bacterium]